MHSLPSPIMPLRTIVLLLTIVSPPLTLASKEVVLSDGTIIDPASGGWQRTRRDILIVDDRIVAYTAGQILNTTAPGPEFGRVTNSNDVCAEIDRQHKAGADFIKIYSGDRYTRRLTSWEETESLHDEIRNDYLLGRGPISATVCATAREPAMARRCSKASDRLDGPGHERGARYKKRGLSCRRRNLATDGRVQAQERAEQRSAARGHLHPRRVPASEPRNDAQRLGRLSINRWES